MPSGTDELAQLLREGGIHSSKFSPAIQTLLGGKTGRRASPQAPIATYDDSEDEDEQHGSGLDFLHTACDHAEGGNHDAAFDALRLARQFRAPRDKIKKVERYIAALRD